MAADTPTEKKLLNLLPLAMLILLALFGLRTISHGAFWSHLADGRAIAQSGIPREAAGSFMAAEGGWVNTSWLYDLLLFGLYQIGGSGLVILLHAASAVAAFTLLTRGLRQRVGPLSLSLALLICVTAFSYQFTVQPAVLTLVLPAAFMVLLLHRVPAKKSWPIMLVLQILWCNLHSSFWLGPVLALLTAIQQWSDNEDPEESARFKQTLLLTGLLAAVTLLNPYGLKLHSFILANWNSMAQQHTFEWVSVLSGQFKNSLPAGLIILLLIIGGSGLLTLKQRLPLVLTVLAVVSVFASLRAIRFIHYMSLLAFPFIAISLQADSDTLSDLFKGLSEDSRAKARDVVMIIALLLVVLSAAGLFSNRYFVRSGSLSRFGLGLSDGLFPAGASALLEREDVPDRLLHTPIDGSWLRWHHPDREVYVDQRIGVYPDDLYEQWSMALNGDAEAWKKAVEEQDVDGVLLNNCWPGAGPALRRILEREGWALAYFDGRTSLAVRDDENYRSLNEDVNVQQAGLDALQAEFAPYAAKVSRGKRPPLNPALIGGGAALYALGQWERARPIYELLVHHTPNMGSAWLRLGRMRLAGGQPEAAVEVLERACELAGKNAIAWLWLSEAYAAAGRTEEAGLAFERCRKISPDTAKVYGSPLERP